MDIKLRQKRHVKKRVIMKSLLTTSILSFVVFVVTALISYEHYKAFFVLSAVLFIIAVIIAPWARKPYTNRRFEMTISDSTGRFTPEIKQFNEETKNL